MKTDSRYMFYDGGARELLQGPFSSQFQDILDVIHGIIPEKTYECKSRDQRKNGRHYWNPTTLNLDFKREFCSRLGWESEPKYTFPLLPTQALWNLMKHLSPEEMRSFYQGHTGSTLEFKNLRGDYRHSNTGIGVEVQLGNGVYKTHDFSKFGSCVIFGFLQVGVIISPLQSMHREMSDGTTHYDRLKKDYTLWRMHSNPYPILLIGVEP